ncbi:M23 family metallopeptidase [Psychroserpens sp. Hel_I_66]|uniref:M23 family metallopeptidase n=1 Tax=Psychroserpens sp. Hel_I_66 TaxID=1250004 RepID=UPI00068F9E9C|nr:M23 family metallopeptidase [Psychroserpens sp. Hel_I_66]
MQKVSDVITKPSAREVLERDFKDNDSIYNSYSESYEQSKSNILKLELPTVITSQTDTLAFSILAYTIDLKRGERFKMLSPIAPDSLQLAIDVFAFENDSVVAQKPMVSNEPNSNTLEFDVTKSGSYKLVVMPNRKTTTTFSMQLYTEPTFEFPVSGKSNSAIQSFWGASRGGGSRSHKGIDIFAKRGTPVVAAVDGYISNTGNRGLGGKQVWLRDGVFGQSLYYAHLDSIAVSGSDRVKVGDTLGFVGNTGNARTTSPHLHFGIYTRNGAVDPLPFVKQTEPMEIKETALFTNAKTRLKTNELRVGAGVKNEKILDLEQDIPLKILGKTERWFHLRVNDSIEGFMHDSLLKEEN